MTLMLIAAFGRSSQVTLPVSPLPVPAYFLTTVGTVILTTFPLMSTFPDVERALLREQQLRVLRVLAVVAGASSIIALTHAVSRPDLAAEVRRLLPLLLILGAIAIAAVVVVGDLAWLVPATLGGLSLLLIGDVPSPLSRALPQLSLLGLVPLLVASAALFAWRGPRLPS